MSHIVMVGHNYYEPSMAPLKQLLWPGPETPDIILPTPLQFGAISRLEFSPSGDYLAIAYNHDGSGYTGASLAVYETAGLTEVATFGEATFNALAFDPLASAWLAALSTSLDLQIIDPSDGSVIDTVAQPISGSFNTIAALPDGGALMAGSGRYSGGYVSELVSIDTTTWTASVVATMSPLQIFSVAPSPNGQWVAVGFVENDATLGRVYAVSGWGLVATIPGEYVGSARVLSWSSDSSRLAIGGEYGSLQVYDTSTWALISGTPSVSPSGGLYAPDGSLLHLIVSSELQTYNASTWALLDTQTLAEYDTAIAVSSAIGSHSVSGVVYDADGDPVARDVSLLRRSDLLRLDHTTSDATTGEYSLSSLISAEAIVISLDAADDYNDLIRRVVPD
jgi:WD40 repeat protein